ncbi:hypothetical protein BC835DRAFT_1308847 [Cytidiella melzeri]|nr:hypothetical protein BC835DRAFT_1308847 [Cytidiella melzeri]
MRHKGNSVATKGNSVLTGKKLRPLSNKTRVFARLVRKRTCSLQHYLSTSRPRRTSKTGLTGMVRRETKSQRRLKKWGTSDEDGDKGVAIGSRYVWTLNCTPKVIQFAFEPDGLTARKAEPEPPSDGGEQHDTILHRLSPRMTIGLEHVRAGPRSTSQCGGLDDLTCLLPALHNIESHRKRENWMMYIYYPNRKDAVLCRKHPQIIFQLSSSILPHKTLADDGHVESAHSVVDLVANCHQLLRHTLCMPTAFYNNTTRELHNRARSHVMLGSGFVRSSDSGWRNRPMAENIAVNLLFERLRRNVRGEEIVARLSVSSCAQERGWRARERERKRETETETEKAGLERAVRGQEKDEHGTLHKRVHYPLVQHKPWRWESERESERERRRMRGLERAIYPVVGDIVRPQHRKPRQITRCRRRSHYEVTTLEDRVGRVIGDILASRRIGQRSSLSRLVLLASSAKTACAQLFTLLLAILYELKTANTYKITRCRSRSNYEVTTLEDRVGRVIGDILAHSILGNWPAIFVIEACTACIKGQDTAVCGDISNTFARYIASTAIQPTCDTFARIRITGYKHIHQSKRRLSSRASSCHRLISSIFDGLRTRFAYDSYFYFAFVPLQPHYDGPVLGCLSPFAVEVEQVAGRAQACPINSSLLGNGSGRLSSNLCCACSVAFFAVFQARTLRQRLPPILCHSARAILATRLARAAFTLRFAFLSYLLMKEEVAGTHVWEDISQDEHTIPLTMCNVLRTSWICDWSIPQLEPLLTLRGHLTLTRNANGIVTSPTLYPLGTPSPFGLRTPVTQSAQNYHLPHALCTNNSDLTIDGLGLFRTLRWFCTPPTANFMAHHFAVMIIMVTSLLIQPPVLRTAGSQGRQLPGESYKEFVSREEDIQTKWALAESEEDRRKRLARIASQQSQPLPGRNGPSVYIWTHEQDTKIRRKVLFRDVRYVWRHTTAEQHIYNSFRHEYDINYLSAYILNDGNAAQDTAETGLHNTGAYLMPNHPYISSPLPSPSRAPVSLSSSQVEPSQLDVTVQLAQNTTHLPTVSTPRRNLEELDFLRLQSHSNTYPKVSFTTPDNMHTSEGSLPSMSLEESTALLLDDDNGGDVLHTDAFSAVITPSITEVLTLRYGFTRPDGEWTPRKTEAQSWLPERDRAKLYQSMGSWTKSDSIDNSILPSAADFVAYVKARELPPAEICDMNPEAEEHGLEADTSRSFIAVSKFDDRESKSAWYRVESIDSKPACCTAGWSLLIQHAVSVLHARRARFGSDLSMLLVAFVARGIPVRIISPIPFDTVLPQNTIPTNMILDNAPIGLGVKPHNTNLTMEDYKAYIRVRDNLLEGVAGQTALTQGGIAWRLAWGVCSINNVLEGPPVNERSGHVHLKQMWQTGIHTLKPH